MSTISSSKVMHPVLTHGSEARTGLKSHFFCFLICHGHLESNSKILLINDYTVSYRVIKSLCRACVSIVSKTNIDVPGLYSWFILDPPALLD